MYGTVGPTCSENSIPKAIQIATICLELKICEQ